MEFTKDYFLSRLQNGENIDTIGEELAAAMNAAVAEHKASTAKKVAEEAKHKATEEAKHKLASEMLDIVKEYAELTAPEALVYLNDISKKDIQSFMEGLDHMFTLVKAAHVFTAPTAPVSKATIGALRSDDDVLADFIKMFS